MRRKPKVATSPSPAAPVAGRPFSEVFHQPRWAPKDRWRIVGSGVMTFPEKSPNVKLVLSACGELGVPFRSRGTGSPANADAYYLKARFLDGGIDGETGNYWGGQRGVWVTGRKTVAVLALKIGLKVKSASVLQGLDPSVALEALVRELRSTRLVEPTDDYVDLPEPPQIRMS